MLLFSVFRKEKEPGLKSMAGTLKLKRAIIDDLCTFP